MEAALGWDGTETIEVNGFWTGKGAISHLSLLGTSTAVPEPTTMLLLGLGLVGLAGVGRKFKK
ncbi:PEP-CTERM sorting domain-containing protein [Syntrophus sp. (in: bacteria)]|uniref:PEP-CTERM sorting domain-containing protein n=1 Tax=Syntrophus sp. (in: bacteria) TaxID=48412 RepID=UPI00345E09B6